MIAVVVAKDLRKCYGKTVAVDGISFDIAPGRIVGLIGTNEMGWMIAQETPRNDWA